MGTFKISEDFYSIQCEGVSSGYPAYFVRLTDCNLTCGASQQMVNQMRKNLMESTPGDFQGDLHSEGNATWTCDTIPVWIKGQERPFQYLIDRWKEQGIYEDILNGIIHIIWTGGEPTLPYHQEAIAKFYNWWFEMEYKIQTGNGILRVNPTFQPYMEIETNGTIALTDDLFPILDQINCSAKLENSGMFEKKRIVSDAIKSIMFHKNYQFKFVISNESDWAEIERDYIIPFQIPLTRVVCMPGLDSQADFFERTRFVLEMAKKHKFIGLTRLHVAAWDRTTGV